ncbi:hypothetical protein CTAYLR_002076 [Chrysophaeum taylorii]|uniref:BART domain-containing protein n=1 Tax=Chrysophaeum taylorii TaxID=2483200 RepID=A0AAD7UN48_9STRA|nr:hypothetical protein CTAYLR_002076 [Chrysophaeum taylorii]
MDGFEELIKKIRRSMMKASKDDEEKKAKEVEPRAAYWQGAGGMKEWMDDNCDLFLGSTKTGEQRPEFFELYKEFETRVGSALEAFVEREFQQESERRDKLRELYDEIRRGLDDNQPSLDAAISMLLAAADYHKFCSIMRQRASDIRRAPPKLEAKQ